VGLWGHQDGWGSQVLLEVLENLLCFLSPLELVLFFKELEEREPLMLSHEMNLLKAAIHPINFCTSWRLSGGAIFVIADTFSGLGLIPFRETIYPSSFPEGMPNVHFSRFNLILNFLRLAKVSTRSKTGPLSSHLLTTTSST
jgi:hypothetical protein